MKWLPSKKGLILKRGAVCKNRGFTLIELLVVIAIIGVLATIIVASFTSAQRRGRDARRKADMDAIKKALALWKLDTPPGNLYPSCPGDLDTTCTITTATNFNTVPRAITPTYIRTVPQDPLGGTFFYTYDPGTCSGGLGSTCAAYTLYAVLENSTDPSDTTSQTACGIGVPVNDRYMVCNE